MERWSGVFPAVTTKLKKDGALDIPACQSAIDRLVNGGVSGIIVLPMLGENASIGEADREVIVRSAVEAVGGRLPVLSGLAERSGIDAVAAAKRYRAYGAEGLMAFPSLSYMTDARETANWYRTIGEATDLPIMIYNNPLAYKVDVTPTILAELTNVPTIVYVKEETGDPRRVTDIYNELGDRFSVFCGIDDLLLESMAVGVQGWVSGMTNVWPRECVTLFNLCMAGKYSEARALYRILTPAFHLDTHVKLVQYIKLADNIVNGAPEWLRAPRLPLIGAERAGVEETVARTEAALRRFRHAALA